MINSHVIVVDYQYEKNMRMHSPPHPVAVLGDGIFTDPQISVTDFAAHLGVTRVALSCMLNAKAGISTDMALRLAAALGGSTQYGCVCRQTMMTGVRRRLLKRGFEDSASELVS